MLFGGPQFISIIEIGKRCGKEFGIGISREMEKTSKTASSENAIAAINGSYFDMKYGNSVCFLKNKKNIIDTTTASELKLRVNGAIYIKKGKLKIIEWNKKIEKNYKKHRGTTIASGPIMLKNGKICNWNSCGKNFIEAKHPRSGIATTNEGKTLFITADGRSANNAIGMSIPEFAYLIKIMNGKEALNLDGGGSTTLWNAGNVINHPCDNKKFDNNGERKVANIIFVK